MYIHSFTKVEDNVESICTLILFDDVHQKNVHEIVALERERESRRLSKTLLVFDYNT